MTDFAALASQHGDLSEDAQKKAAKAIAGDMAQMHKDYVKELLALIDSGAIDPLNPQSFLKKDVYDKLDQEWKDKTDLALINLAMQIKLIADFHRDPATPNESPHLQTMIEQLWQMKERIEKEVDVFIF